MLAVAAREVRERAARRADGVARVPRVRALAVDLRRAARRVVAELDHGRGAERRDLVEAARAAVDHGVLDARPRSF